MNQTTRSRFLGLDSFKPPFLFLHVLASMQLKMWRCQQKRGLATKEKSMKMGRVLVLRCSKTNNKISVRYKLEKSKSTWWYKE